MIPSLHTPARAVAIRFQPVHDLSLGTLDLPIIAGRLARREERRWPEATSSPRLDLSGLCSSDTSPTAARHEALLRKLVVEEAERMGIELRPGEIACQIQLFRDRFRLDSVATMRDWLDHAGLTFDKLASLFRAELLVDKVEQLHWAHIERELEAHRALLSACADLRRPSSSQEAEKISALLGQDCADRILRRRILLRVLAEHELSRRGLRVLRDEIEATLDCFRECFGRPPAAEMTSWLTVSGLSQEAFSRHLQDFTTVLKLDLLRADAIEAERALCNAVKTVVAWAPRRASAR
jgi:hypothetical protein